MNAPVRLSSPAAAELHRRAALAARTNAPGQWPTELLPRLHYALSIVGWSTTELARRIRTHDSKVRAMLTGRQAIPPPLVDWLVEIAEFVLANPTPRQWISQ